VHDHITRQAADLARIVKLPLPVEERFMQFVESFMRVAARERDELNPGLMETQRVRKPYALLLYGMMIWTFSWYRRSGDIGPQELAARISHLFVNGFKAPLPEIEYLR